VLAVAARLGQFQGEKVQEELAVGKVGEGVVQGLVSDDFFALGAPGDVARDSGEADDRPFGVF
jgi:hypothetical protein